MSGKWIKSWQRTTVKDEINSQKRPLFVRNDVSGYSQVSSRPPAMLSPVCEALKWFLGNHGRKFLTS